MQPKKSKIRKGEEIVEEFSADDYNSQLDSIEDKVLIPLIAQNYFSVRAPPA